MISWLYVPQGIAPHPKDLQGKRLLPSCSRAVTAAVDCLKGNSTWVKKEPSVRQEFCLHFVNSCCIKIQPDSSTFVWVEEYSALIPQLGDIYCLYARRENQSILLSELPADVSSNPSTAVKQYFLWIQKIHQVLSLWKSKLDNHAANYDEIYGYNHKRHYIHEIAQHVFASDLVISADTLTRLGKIFLEKFEELNFLLLRYIPEDPKPGW